MLSRPRFSTWPERMSRVLVLAACLSLMVVPAAASAVGSDVSAALPLTAAFAADPSQGRFSLDFIDTDLVDVIKALAEQSGANIAVSGKVEGRITLHLSNVTLEQALTIVTKLGGVDYAKVDSTYVVGSGEEVQALKAASYSSRVVTLEQIPADYAAQTLAKATPEVSVSAQPGTRAVVLVGPADALARAEQVLADVDVPAPAAPPVTEVVALQYVGADEAAAMLADAAPKVEVAAGPSGNLVLSGNGADVLAAKGLLANFDVAPAVGVAERMAYVVKYCQPAELAETLTALLPGLQVTLGPRTVTPLVTPASGGAGAAAAMAYLSGGQLAAPSAGGTAEAATSPVTTLVLSGSKSLLGRAQQLLAMLDVAPRQVRVKVTITEMQEDASKRLGVDWQDLAGLSSVVVGELPDGAISDVANSRSIKLGHFSRSNLQLSGLLNALVTEHKARILANPTVVILDGREATIHSGDKIYYPQIVGYNQVGLPILQATEIDTGVTLKVNPRIGPDGTVTLTVVPTVSSVVESKFFPGYPQITERSAVTTIRVKDGETFALGGLISDEERLTVSKVPLLGDIPLLGDLLFKSTHRQPQHTEVMVILTPEVVQDV